MVLQQSGGLTSPTLSYWNITARRIFHDIDSVNVTGTVVSLAKHLKLIDWLNYLLEWC